MKPLFQNSLIPMIRIHLQPKGFGWLNASKSSQIGSTWNLPRNHQTSIQSSAMVRSRRHPEGQADDTPIRKGSKETGQSRKKRRPVVGGSPLNSDDEEDAFGGEEDEGLEGLGVPLDSVVKVSLDHLCTCFFFLWNFLENNILDVHSVTLPAWCVQFSPIPFHESTTHRGLVCSQHSQLFLAVATTTAVSFQWFRFHYRCRAAGDSDQRPLHWMAYTSEGAT